MEFLKNDQPHIILCDIKMPIISDLEMAKTIKNFYPTIKFIFLSGYEDFEYAQTALKLSAVDYLTKPVNNELLLESIKKAISQVEENQTISKITSTVYLF